MNEIATVEPPVPETPAAPPVEESTTLADHEAEFYSGKKPAKESAPTATVESSPTEETAEEIKARDDKGRFRKPSAKAAASSEDVPRIRELTRKLHEAERERDEWKTKVSAPAPAAPIPAPPKLEPVAPPAAFTDREPIIQDFANAEDPYAAYVRALARYDRKKEQFEAEQLSAKERSDKQEADTIAQATATFHKLQTAYNERLAPFLETHPDFNTLLKSVASVPLSPLLQATVLLHDKGHELVYHLLRHPDQLAEMQLLTDGKAVNEQNVESSTRWLTSRAKAASTGSTSSTAPPFTVPRPPNPVQTGPMSTGDELPDDSSSLAEHERAFYKRKGRR